MFYGPSLFLVGSASCQLREAQLPELHVDYGLEVLGVPEPASQPLGRLDHRVHALEHGVGQPVVEVVQHLVPVLAQHLGDLLHLRHVGVHDPAAQRVQLGRRLPARPAFVDRLQGLAHLARPRRLEVLARQLALPGRLALCEVALVLEPYVLAPGEQGALLRRLPGLGRPHLVDLPGRDVFSQVGLSKKSIGI